MSDQSGQASAVGSSVIAAIRTDVPEFEDAFRRELDAEDGQMGAFQAMSTFAGWLGNRIEHAPDGPDVLRAFRIVERIASSNDYPIGGELVAEFVEVLGNNPQAVSLIGPETRRYR